MVISNEQLVEIVGAGGIVVMDASTMTLNQIHAIAVAAASTGKGKMTLKKVSGLTWIQLKQLSTVAPGLITYDLTT